METLEESLREKKKDVEQVAKEVATAIQLEDYTIASHILKPYDYSFKKKVERLLMPSLKQKFEAICP